VVSVECGFHIFGKSFVLFNYTEHSLGSDVPNKSARGTDTSRRKPPSNVEARCSQPGITLAAERQIHTQCSASNLGLARLRHRVASWGCE
jgi:hypothetical protein